MLQHLLQGDVAITLVPGFDKVSENLTKFRWNMQVPLPYPFPSRHCIFRNITVAGKPFSFEIHNHYDRVIEVIRSPESDAPWIRAFLEDKRRPTPTPSVGCVSVTREALQSVVFFDGQTDYSSPSEAFAGAEATIKCCLDWLASFLAACQRDAPYLVSWLVYPVSLFDVGNVHHEVRAFCTAHAQWHLIACAVQSSLGRQLQQSTFFMEPPTTLEAVSPLDTTNELLAEALMALYRGMPRLTVVNSYTALESLANVVYSQMRVAQLVANKVPKEYAESVVEGERVLHRTEATFLFHSAIKSASGRSLLEENKHQYDAIAKTQKLRHRVAHTGYKPTMDEAREAHKLCCELVRWFAGVGNLPVKPLLPDPAVTSSSVVAGIFGGCHRIVAQGSSVTAPSTSTGEKAGNGDVDDMSAEPRTVTDQPRD